MTTLVDLDHYPIAVVRQLMRGANLIEAIDSLGQSRHVGIRCLSVGRTIHREPEVGKQGQCLFLALHMLALEILVGGICCIDIDQQATASRDLWVELLQRTTRRIALIGKRFLAIGCLLGIQTVESTLWHEHLASHLEIMRQFDDRKQVVASRYRIETQRHIAYGLDILVHRLSLNLIATSNSISKHSIGIDERYAKAIVFRLIGK